MKRNKLIAIAIALVAIIIVSGVSYAAVTSGTVAAKSISLTDFSIKASKMTLTNAEIQSVNVSGVTEYKVTMSKVAISNMVLTKYINSTTSTTIRSPCAIGKNVTLYAYHIYATNTSYVNLTISENPHFTITANQIIQTNVTINASYQKAGSFSMSNLNLGFSFLVAYMMLGGNRMVIK
jgi:hypothetical protein